jgi:hypothetical protein
MFIVASLLGVDVVFGNTLLTTYRPPFVPYAMAVLVTVLLMLLARRLPTRWASPAESPRWGSLKLGLAGFVGIALLFFAGWALPALRFPAALTIAFMTMAAVGAWRLIRWGSGEGAWDDRGRLALAAGGLSVFILLAFLAEGDPSRVDNPAGMSLVGLAAVAGLLLLYLRIRRRTGSKIKPS